MTSVGRSGRACAIAMLGLLVTLTIASCGSSGGSRDASRLVGSWTLRSATNARGTLEWPSTTAGITFSADGRVRGSSGCNDFGGGYETDGDRLRFLAVGMTSKGCADDASNAQETAFGIAFSKPLTFEVNGDTLTIAATDGVTSLILART